LKLKGKRRAEEERGRKFGRKGTERRKKYEGYRKMQRKTKKGMTSKSARISEGKGDERKKKDCTTERREGAWKGGKRFCGTLSH